MRRGSIADDLDPVGELHTQDQFWQLVVAVDPAPTFLGAFDKLEDHGERGLVRQAAFRSDRFEPADCRFARAKPTLSRKSKSAAVGKELPIRDVSLSASIGAKRT